MPTWLDASPIVPITGASHPTDVEIHVARQPERWKSREEMKQDMASLQGARALAATLNERGE